MAKPADNLRDAVEKTVEATLGSAERSRSAAQGALDDLVESVEDLRKNAEDRLSRGRRLDKIEERLPAKRARAKRSPKRSS
jgi:hypothetical protein